MLGELRAPLGVFGVLGNHDDSADPRFVTRSLEAHGVTVLRNFNLRIETRGERLWIAGVDDVLTGNAKLGQALRGIPADDATVLLAHEPDFADSAASQAVDLQLYSIDFLGAQGVGMGAVLMDLAGAYRDTPYPRVESLAEFESRLEDW